jgi:uncharacterized protein YhdP
VSETEEPTLNIEIDADRRTEPKDKRSPEEPPRSSQPKKFLRRAARLSAIGLTLGLALVALGLWQADRIINRFVPDLQVWLQSATGTQVAIGKVETGWRGFRPEVRLLQVKVGGGAGEPTATAQRLELELDLSQSLVGLTPRFGRLAAHSLQVEATAASKPSAPIQATDLLQALGLHLATRFELVLTDAQWKEPERFTLRIQSGRAVTHLGKDAWEGELKLEKSVLDAPLLWLRPLEVQSLQTSIMLQGLQAAPPKLILAMDPAVARIPGTELHFGLKGEWPNDLKSLPRIELRLETLEASLATIRSLLPVALFGSELKLWIDTAIQKGETSGGTLSLSGPSQDWAERGIAAFKDPAVSKLEVELPFSEATVDYRDDWPKLEQATGKFIFRQTDLSAEIASAQTVHGVLRDGRIGLSKLHEGNPLLKASGEIQATPEQMTSLLTEGLLSGMKPLLEHALPSDPWTTRFQATVPLEKGDWSAELELSAGGLKLKKQAVHLTEITGQANLTPQNVGIQGGKVRWGERLLEWSAQTNAHSKDKKRTTQLSLSGAFEAARLREAVPALALPNFIEGSSLWKIEAGIQHGETQQLTLEGHSTLVGSKINLPPPLQKDAEEQWPLSFKTRWNDSQLLEAKGIWSGGGTEAELDYRPPLVKAQVRTGAIDLETWNQWAQQNLPATSSSPESPEKTVGLLRLTSPELKWKNHRFAQANIQLDAAESAFVVNLQARGLAGKIESTRPWKRGKLKIELSQLHLAEWPFEWPPKAPAEGAAQPPATEEDLPAPWDMREWPTLALKIGQLKIGEEAFGELLFKATRSEDRFTVDFGRWTAPQFEFVLKSAEATLGEEPGKGTTSGELELKLNKFNRPTPFMRSAEAFSASDGRIKGKLSWPGAPNQFRISASTGEVSAYLSSGKWTGVKSFIQTLFNTLSLNFEDSRKKIMRFAKLTFDANVVPKKVTIREARALFGTVFARIEGNIGFPGRDLDLEAMITPAVADLREDDVGFETDDTEDSSAPRRANPKNLFTHRYSVKGNWEQPQISLK